MNVRPEVSALLDQFQAATNDLEAEDLIQVSSATKRIAFAYERFRNTLEPDEEEILRRGAIVRILERRLSEDRPPVAIAITLLQELIRGNYVKPQPKTLAQNVGRILKKGMQIHSRLASTDTSWFLRLVAVAIDHQLFPPDHQEALVHLMYHDTYRRTVWADFYVAESDRPTQLYLACHRALFAADNNELSYHYFQHNFPTWSKLDLTSQEIDEIVTKLPAFHINIEAALDHSARDRLTRLLRPVSVPYLILRDVLDEKGGEAFSTNEVFDAATRDAFSNRVSITRSRMSKRAWHSILFLFFTKSLLALLIEVPYERFVLDEVHYLALGTNIAFHPLLLFSLATTVRLPGQKNTDRVVEHLMKIVSGEGELPTVVISSPRKYGATTWSIFAIVYALLFMVIFWSLFTFLDRLDFSLLAMFFFVVFLGLVTFLATRIRRSVDDLRIIPHTETALSAVLSFLALPVLEFGRWLAQNIRQLNVLLFFMDRVLEAPFKLLIDVTEEWFDFVRDRREEIIK